MLNNLILKKIWLKGDELPVLVIRCSLINWFWSWLIAFVLIVGACFSMYYLFQRFGQRGLIIVGVIIVLAVVVFFRAYCEYYFTAWILTNIRLVDLYQKGFFQREMSELVYNRIKEVYGKKAGVAAGLFNLGDIYLTPVASRAKFKLGLVRGYEWAIAEIILQQENYERNLHDDKESRAQYLLLKIKKKLGADEFNRLISD